MNKFLLFITFILFTVKVQSQNAPTIGLIYNDSELAYSEGVTLFAPENSTKVYIINQCGEKLNEWTFDDEANRTAYLREDGSVVRAGKEKLSIRAWDNTLTWSIDNAANGIGQHHDIEPLPNGNILVIAYDTYNQEEIDEVGRISDLGDSEFILDRIIEIQPIGTDDFNVVWEWKLYDHLIQEVDETLTNYGIVADHPELMDINFQNDDGNNFCHMNGIDYNPELDQIIFSLRNLNEIYIIDHSTTTAEAATHSGGNSGKGGDFLWRWGNPFAYKNGTGADQQLFRQHDPKWVLAGHENAGAISVFNNQYIKSDETTQSSVELINPTIENGAYVLNEGTFQPTVSDFTFADKILEDSFFEERKSGVEFQKNGNFLIVESGKGRMTEINPEGEMVWSYVNPTGEIVNEQFETVDLKNSIFRAIRYTLDYAAFEGRTMEPLGVIENKNSLSVACHPEEEEEEEVLALSNAQGNSLQMLNPVQDAITFINLPKGKHHIQIFSASGKRVFQQENINYHLPIDLPPGLYWVKLTSSDRQFKMGKILVK